MAGNKKSGKKYVPMVQKKAVPMTEQNRNLDGTYTDRQQYVGQYRKRLAEVMRDLKRGSVSEEDFARLQNFIKFSLAAMDRMSMSDIDKAWMNAEALSILHYEQGMPVVEQPLSTEDLYAVIHDPDKLEDSTNAQR